MACNHLPLVNFLKDVGDHRSGSRTAVDFATDISFVDGGKRVLRLVGGQKSGEPCCGALFVFWAPLRSTGFTGDFDIVETGLMRCAACSIDNIDHSLSHFFQCLWREFESPFGSYLIGCHDLAIELSPETLEEV